MVEILKQKIAQLEENSDQTLLKMVETLSVDPNINWEEILNEERCIPSWEKIKKWPKYHIIKRYSTPGRYKHGMTSAAYTKGRHQRAIIKYTEEKARSAIPDANDEEVATECLESVLNRWSTPDPAALTVVQRVVHTVVRCTRHSIAQAGDTAISELMQQFDEQLIIRRPDTPSQATECPVHTIPHELIHSVPSEVLLGMIDLKKSYVHLQTESARIEPDRLRAEADCKRAEADRLRAETSLYLAKNSSVTSFNKKRKAPDDDGDQWLRREVAHPWNNLMSLSNMVLAAEPPGDNNNLTTKQTLTMVYDRVIEHNILHRVRLLQHKQIGETYTVVYVRPDWIVGATEFAAAFWRNAGAPRAIAVDNHEEEKQIEEVINPPTQGPVAHKGPRMKVAVCKLPKGAHDLAAAVLPRDDEDVRLLSPEQRQQAVRWLDEDFVRIADVGEKWSVLWPPRPRSALTAGVIPTFIDVERDPIVSQLRHWLLERLAQVEPSTLRPAPVYPAVQPNPPDLRPPEQAPLEMQGLEDHNVWKELVAAGLQCCLWSYYVTAYNRWNPQTHPIPSSAREPCPERLRQWRRLTQLGNGDPKEAVGGGDLLTYRQICDCLGWQGLGHEAGNIQALTTALVRHRQSGKPVTAWLTVCSGNTPNLWKWRDCLYEMRMAAVFVERLRIVGCDNLKFLAGDVRSSMTGCNDR